MLINLIQQQLLDLQSLCRISDEAIKITYGRDYDPNVIRKKYNDNRERLLDIVRELDLGRNVDWDKVSGMLRTMDD